MSPQGLSPLLRAATSPLCGHDWPLRFACSYFEYCAHVWAATESRGRRRSPHSRSLSRSATNLSSLLDLERDTAEARDVPMRPWPILQMEHSNWRSRRKSSRRPRLPGTWRSPLRHGLAYDRRMAQLRPADLLWFR